MSGWAPAGLFLGEFESSREERTERERAARREALRPKPVQSPLLSIVRETEPEPAPRTSGRPPVEDSREIRAELLDRIGRGEPRYRAARAVGWSDSTLDRKLRSDEALREQVQEARAEAKARLGGHTLKVDPVVRYGGYRFAGGCSCGGWRTRALFSRLSVRSAWARHIAAIREESA